MGGALPLIQLLFAWKQRNAPMCARTQNQLVMFARGRILKGMLTLNSINFIYSASMCLFKKKSSCLWDALHYPDIPAPRMKRHLLKHIKDVFHLIFNLLFLFRLPIWNFYCLGLICWLYMMKTFHSETRFTISVLHLWINPNLSDFRPFICDADRQRQLYSSGWQHSATLVFVLRQSKSNIAAQSRFDPPTS